MTKEPQKPKGTRPLLTIAIPTYNRAPLLRELLSVLFDQLVAEPRVELIISDNASADETPAVVQEYKERGLQLCYLRNDINLGPNKNILQCFELARGKYVWIFGDDDIIVPGGLAKILPLLALESYALVYLTPYSFRHDYAGERSPYRLRRYAAETIPDGWQFARTVGTMITFLSSMIVNKDFYLTTEHEPLINFLETNFIHLGWLLPVLGSNAKCLVVWERLVAARNGTRCGYGICEVFGRNYKRALDLTLGHRKNIATELLNCTLRNWFPEMIMQTRRGTAGALEAENIRELLEPLHGKNWRYWIYVFPLITLPLALAGVWYSMIAFRRDIGELSRLARTYLFAHRNVVNKLSSSTIRDGSSEEDSDKVLIVK